jgi:hypothetical protein
VLYALDAKVDSVVSMATGETRGPGGASPTEVWWESLSHRPPFKYVVSAYQQAHDAVVQTPIYTKCARPAPLTVVSATRLPVKRPFAPACIVCCICLLPFATRTRWLSHSACWSTRRCGTHIDGVISACRALELGGETMTRVHDSRLYKSLLPLVGPLTEPAVKRILESPTFQVCCAPLTDVKLDRGMILVNQAT